MSKYYINNKYGSKRSRKAKVSVSGIGGSSYSFDYVDKHETVLNVPHADAGNKLFSLQPQNKTALTADQIRDANMIAISNVGLQAAVVIFKVPLWTLGTDAADAVDGSATKNYIQWLLKPGSSFLIPGIRCVATAGTTSAANGRIEYGFDGTAKANDNERPLQLHPILIETTGGKYQTNTVQNENLSTKSTDETGSFNYGLDEYAPSGNLVNGIGDGKTGLFNHGGLASITASAHYVPGSICVRFHDPAYSVVVEKGQTPATKTGLAVSTAYSFKLVLDGGTEQEVSFTTDSKDKTWGNGIAGNGLLAKINNSLRNLAPWKDQSGKVIPTPHMSIVNGSVRLNGTTRKHNGWNGGTNDSSFTWNTGGTGSLTDWHSVGQIGNKTALNSAVIPAKLKELDRTGEMMFDDSYGNLILGSKKVGEIDYNTGFISFSGAPAHSSFEYTAVYDSALGGTSYDDYVQSNVRNNYLEEIYATSTNPMREAKVKVTAFTI